jgi:hypothetical protein
MSDLRQAAQQALEALEKTHTQPGCEQWQAERKASVALRAALAQQELATEKLVEAIMPRPAPSLEFLDGFREGFRAALAQQSEPVAWLVRWNDDGVERTTVQLTKPDGRWSQDRLLPLYIAPPRREWQGLTEEQILWIENNTRSRSYLVHARAIEAKLKEKNNG